VQQDRAHGSSRIPACSANTTLRLLYVAGFVVSLLSLASAAWSTAAVIRSSDAGVTVGYCKLPASSYCTTRRQTVHQRSLVLCSAQMRHKRCLWFKSEVLRWRICKALSLARVRGAEALSTLHTQILCRRLFYQHQRHVWTMI